MSYLHSRTRVLAVAAATAFALCALLATTASASVVEAKWGEETWNLRMSGSVTVEPTYGSAVDCGPATTTSGFAFPGSTNYIVENESIGSVPRIRYIGFNCEGGTKLQLSLGPGSPWGSYAVYDSTLGYELKSEFTTGGPLPASPFGKYMASPFAVSFINAGTIGEREKPEEEAIEEGEMEEFEYTESLVRFAHTRIGSSEGGGFIYLTGDLTVDDGAGSPRTLTH